MRSGSSVSAIWAVAVLWTEIGIWAQAPMFTLQPFDQKVRPGVTVEFKAAAQGPGTISYQWHLNGAVIPLGTAATLSVAVTSEDQAGEYYVVATGSGGSAESTRAELEVAMNTPAIGQRFWRPAAAFPGGFFSGIAYGNGTLVAVGSAGTIATSRDGTVWRDVSPPVYAAISKVRFLNGGFWATMGGNLLRSADGLGWTVVTTGANELADIAFKEGVYVAVGNGQVARSIDGINWNVVGMANVTFTSIVIGNGLFAARAGNDRVYLSEGGETWASNVPPGGVPQVRSGISFFAGKFFVIRFQGIYSSPDGTNWTLAQAIPGETREGEHYYAVMAPGPSRMLFLAEATRAIIRTDDGVAFVTETTLESAVAGAHTESEFFIVSRGIKRSPNGVIWTLVRPPIFDHNPPRVHFANGRFFITDDGGALPGSGIVEYSDGIDEWNQRISFTLPIVGVAYGASKYVAASTIDDGIFTSADGVNFARVTSTGSRAPISLVFEDGEFLTASVGTGQISRSANGTTWTGSGTAAATATFWATKHGGTAVASGYQGRMYYSSNAGAWQQVASGYSSSIYTVTHGDGKFVAGGFNGAVPFSFDGVTWHQGKFPSTTRINHIAWSEAEGLFLGATDAGLMFSWDGINWELTPLHTAEMLTGVGYGNGKWVVAGQAGTLFQTGIPNGLASPGLGGASNGTDLALTVIGGFGQRIRLETATEFNPKAWTLVDRIVSNGEPTVRVVPIVAEETRFFRALPE